MSRLLTSEELFKRLDRLAIYRDLDGGGSETASSAISAGDTTIPVGTSGDFGAGTWFRVDAGNNLELLRAKSEDGAGTITVTTEAEYDHQSGVDVIEQEEVEVGEVADGGITRSNDVGRTEIDVETQRGTYAIMTTDVTQRFELSVVNHNLENLLLSMGIPESEVKGGGAGVDDPDFARMALEKVNTLSNVSLAFFGILEDLRNVEVRGWNCDFDANISMDYVSGEGVEIPLAVEVNTVEYRVYP